MHSARAVLVDWRADRHSLGMTDTARFPLDEGAASRLIHAEIENPRTRARMLAVAARILGNAADAEDCLQEALILAARNAGRFEGRSSPTTWLFIVVSNACRMQRRAMRRERRGGAMVHVSMDEVLADQTAADDNSDPEQSIQGRDVLAVVADELRLVPARDARLFERCVLEDRPLRDVAAEHSLTRQALKSRLFRVRRRLAERLEAAGIRASA
jgi:RNA polymerase sigma-70 factor (ECF subfamily)